MDIIVGLFVGIIFGIFIYSQTLLPLFYSLPLSVYYYLRGEVKVGAIFIQIVPLLVWIIVLFILFIVIDTFIPSIIDYLIINIGFIYGQLISIVIILLNFLRSSGRYDMKADYMEYTYARYRK